MANLTLNFKPVESQGNSTFAPIGTFADVLATKGVTEWRPTSKGNGFNVFNADGEFITLNMSKALNTAYSAGEITIDQLGQCQVIEGQNAQGEPRTYLTLPGNAERISFSAKKALVAFNKAEAIKLTSTKQLSAQAMAWII